MSPCVEGQAACFGWEAYMYVVLFFFSQLIRKETLETIVNDVSRIYDDLLLDKSCELDYYVVLS